MRDVADAAALAMREKVKLGNRLHKKREPIAAIGSRSGQRISCLEKSAITDCGADPNFSIC